MALILEREGVALSAAERNKRNDNLTKIENAFNEISNAVPEAQAAKLLAEEAKAQAVASEEKSDSVQTQINQLVIDGDSSVEAAQARVSADGTSHVTLKERLDVEHQDLAGKLAEKVPIAEQMKGKPGQKFQVIAGTVRKADSTGWSYVEDTLHAKTGLDTVADNSYNLVLNYGFTATKVGTLIVTPDEELAMRGVSCGSSVGTASANVRITMPMSLKTKGRATILEIDSILATYVSIAQLTDQSGYKLTHTYAIANTVNDVPVTQVQSAVGTTDVEGLEVRTKHTQNSVEVRAYANFHGYIGYNATNANFPVTTNNTKKPVVEWDATTNSVKVTPEMLNNQYDLNITGINTPYLPMIYAKTTTYFSVRFYDIATGALITAPDANMKFIYNSGNKVSNLMPADMIVNVRRGPLTLRPSLFTSSAGNLWIHGLMEV